MVHIIDVKMITLMEQVADDYKNLGKQGRFSKKCIPRGYIPDFNWMTTINKDQDQPIKPIQQQDPTEDATTPAALTEVEGPPSSHLRSKMKQQSTTREQGQPECNPAQQGQLEHNPAQITVNTVQITPKHYSLVQWTKPLLWAKRVSKHKAPIAARCTLLVAMAIYRLKCDQANVLAIQ